MGPQSIASAACCAVSARRRADVEELRRRRPSWSRVCRRPCVQARRGLEEGLAGGLRLGCGRLLLLLRLRLLLRRLLLRRAPVHRGDHRLQPLEARGELLVVGEGLGLVELELLLDLPEAAAQVLVHELRRLSHLRQRVVDVAAQVRLAQVGPDGRRVEERRGLVVDLEELVLQLLQALCVVKARRGRLLPRRAVEARLVAQVAHQPTHHHDVHGALHVVLLHHVRYACPLGARCCCCRGCRHGESKSEKRSIRFCSGTDYQLRYHQQINSKSSLESNAIAICIIRTIS